MNLSSGQCVWVRINSSDHLTEDYPKAGNVQMRMMAIVVKSVSCIMMMVMVMTSMTSTNFSGIQLQ